MAKCISLSSPYKKKILWQNCDVPNKGNQGLKPCLISRALRPQGPLHTALRTHRETVSPALF